MHYKHVVMPRGSATLEWLKATNVFLPGVNNYAIAYTVSPFGAVGTGPGASLTWHPSNLDLPKSGPSLVSCVHTVS